VTFIIFAVEKIANQKIAELHKKNVFEIEVCFERRSDKNLLFVSFPKILLVLFKPLLRGVTLNIWC